MKSKRVVLLFILTILVTSVLVLSACSSSKNERSYESTTESTKDKNFLKVKPNTYSTDKNLVIIAGKTLPNQSLTLSNEEEVLNSTTSSKSGTFIFKAKLLKNSEQKLILETGDLVKEIKVDSLNDLLGTDESASEYTEEKSSSDAPVTESSSAPIINEKSETDESNDTVKLDYQAAGEDNAKRYPAKTASVLFDNSNNKFKGMNYYFSGEIVGTTKLENVTAGEAWLVKNKEGYVMPIEYDYFEASVGDNIEVWGTLSGLKYNSSDFDFSNVVGATGSMHAMSFSKNGKMQY